MKASQLFPSNYLRAEDLDGDAIVTIERITQKDFNGEQKPILLLQDSKGLVLNKTNSNTIAQLHGDEIDGWSGKRITLFPTSVPFRGDIVPAIRVKGDVPSNSGGEKITKEEAEVLKELYSKNAWPVPEVKRTLTEVASCDSLTSIPRDKFYELKDRFGHAYGAPSLVENDEVPF